MATSWELVRRWARAREAVGSRPERATRAGSPHRVVDAFFVRTSHHPLGRHALGDIVLPQEVGHVGGNHGIVAHVDGLSRPRPQRERLASPRWIEHGHHELGSERRIRTVGGDGPDWASSGSRGASAAEPCHVVERRTQFARSAQIEELPNLRPFHGLPRGYVAGDFVLIEDLPDRRQELRELSRERRIVSRWAGERSQLLANQVVEGALRAETQPDRPRCLGLLNPDLFESHDGNIPADTNSPQSPAPLEIGAGRLL